MKKLLSICLVMMVVAALSAATISSPAATVQLTKKQVITMAQLTEAVKQFEAAGYTNVDPAAVLDSMIEDELFNQGADRDGFSVSDTELNTLYARQKSSVDSQAGRVLTNEEFESVVVESYGTVEAYKEYLKNQYTLQNYVYSKKGDIANAVAEPTDKDIKAWYRQNAVDVFSQPEMVRLSVISQQKSNDDAENKKILGTLKGAYEQIKSGKISFEKAVQLYSDDTSSLANGGDWGFLIDQPASRASMGDEFVNEAMVMDEGDLLGVIETPYLYVIAKCTVHLSPRILGLDDVVPEYGVTVTDYIREGLLYQNSQMAFLEAYASLIEDLKSQAKINIIYKAKN